MKKILLAALTTVLATSSFAKPATYIIEAGHTYPSFEADHMGVSYWRGKFTKNSGKVVLDKAAKTGNVEITIDTDSIDFGHQKMNEHAKKADMFNVAKFPTATYKGKIVFAGDKPAKVQGELTLLGVTKPVELTIDRFVCKDHPFAKREVCGGNAIGSFNRSDFGLDYAVKMGFSPEVKLQIQVEALIEDKKD